MREREELKEEAEGWRRVAEILNTTATEAFEAYEEQLEVLRAEVRRTADKVSRQRGALNGLTRLHDENTAIIVQASRYVGQAKELLAELGVNVETEADGRPSLSRSEEHTSELQSLMRISYAVFCLNKKTTTRETIQ